MNSGLLVDDKLGVLYMKSPRSFPGGSTKGRRWTVPCNLRRTERGKRAAKKKHKNDFMGKKGRYD